MTPLPHILVLSALTASLHAAPRTSANYNIDAETIDAGGKRATSANYTNDGSTGLIAGLSTVASPAETAKAGYAAQLYDVTGLVVTAPSSSVNETATLQLSASQLLDDASLLAMSATSVAWSVVSGPVTGISSAGLATAGTVYQNTAASVQGVFGGFTGPFNLTVLDTVADNFGSYSGDGLGDDWQVQYFGLSNPSAAPTVDPDGDGQNNRFEFLAGLIPTNPLSRFLLRIDPVPGQSMQKKLVFSPLVAGRTYSVDVSTSLATGSWTALTGSTQSDAGAERTVTDTVATGAKKFYHVNITKP